MITLCCCGKLPDKHNLEVEVGVGGAKPGDERRDREKPVDTEVALQFEVVMEEEDCAVSGHIAPAVRKQVGMGWRVMLMLHPLSSPHCFQYPGLWDGATYIPESLFSSAKPFWKHPHIATHSDSIQ